MEKYYVFGHMNPDTDSVCASITLSNLKRSLGINAEERVLGPLNKESKFVLNYFKIKEPKYLNDIKLQIRDLKYRKNCFMNENSSIMSVYNYMLNENTTGVPIVKEKNKLTGLITAKEILKKMINIKDNQLLTSYENIVTTLNGEEIVKCDDEIKGKITAVTFAHSTFESTVNLNEEDILIVGDRHYIIDLAIKSKVKLLIIIGGTNVKEEHIKLAKKSHVNIIKTNMNTFETTRLIMYSNYIKKILNEKEPYFVHEKDYYDEFENFSTSLKIDNYPVVDKNGICKGLLRKSEINKLHKKKVILVDHNELDQSAIGLEEAEITEIVDHHRIGRISTNSPINFRNMPVGCTNTIIYFLYKENGIKITKEIAGLMISAIISDTLLFKSPTSTELDKKVVEELNKICKLNIEEYAMEMFKAGTSLEGLTIEEIVNSDSKSFESGETKFIISQAFTMDYESILNNKETYLNTIEKSKKEHNANHFIFAVTDIIKNGSYIFYDENSEELVKKAWNIKKIQNGIFVESCVSRKKQIVPVIMDALEK
jgi:manganese-dependent inorganic pyrophosphatase